MSSQWTRRAAATAALAALGSQLGAAGCKKQSPVRAREAPSSDTAALWKLAPEGTTAAVVFADGAAEQLRRGANTLIAASASAPGSGESVAEMKRELPNEVRLWLADSGLASAGIDFSGGIALFRDDSGGDASVFARLDRTAFRDFHGGEVKGGVDVLADGRTCRPVGSFYACSNQPQMLEAIGRGEGIEPPSARLQGDVEFWTARRPPQVLPPLIMTDYREFRAAVAFEPGALTVRAIAYGEPGAVLRDPPSAELVAGVAAQNPTGIVAVRGRSAWQTLAKAPTFAMLVTQLAGSRGLSELAGVLTGEVVGFALPNRPGGVLRFGLTDTAPAKRLIGACESLATGPIARAVRRGNRCALSVRDPGASMPPLELELWTGGSFLAVGLGDVSERAAAPPMKPIARELLEEPWAIAAWGYGSAFPIIDLAASAAAPFGADEDLLKVAIWTALQVSEMGIAARGTDEGVELLLRIRTIWSNPDDLARELEPIIASAARGDAASISRARDLAGRYPESPFAADVAASGGGIYAAAGPIGLFTAAVVPAFTKLWRKSKTTEARTMVKAIYDGARDYYMGDRGAAGSGASAARRLPTKSTAITPPLGTCCAEGGACTPRASYWTDETWGQLEFAIDESHFYSYQYEVAADGQSFTARAHGDLDCDGKYSTFEMFGEIEPE